VRRTSLLRPGPWSSRLALALALVALWACEACAAIPREIARAFMDQGVPLTNVAIVVQAVDQRRPLLAHRPSAAMSPASVMKLVTTYAALDLLGPSYRWRTEAYVDGTLDQGTLHGNLVLKGRGDPKITIEQWQAFMGALVASGVRRIDGDLVLDRSAFDVPPHDPAAFDGAPLRSYNVGPDALLVNFKSVRLLFAPDPTGTATGVTAEPPLASIHLDRPPALDMLAACESWRARVKPVFIDAGSSADIFFAGAYPASCGEKAWYVALLDPTAYVHGMFATYYAAAGGSFSGSVRDGIAPLDANPVAVLESPPLYDIVRDVNKLSNNVMARQLFLTLALERAGAPASPRRAAQVVQRWLRERKLAMPLLLMENGSGLSRLERVSAGGLARLLVAADKSAVRDEFASSLAVAATDGTVENRFRDGTVAGQALLKTGTLDGVRALAGYVIDAQGRRYAIAALINHPNAARGQPALDFLVQWVFSNGETWSRTVD